MKRQSLAINSMYNIIRTFTTLAFPLLVFMYASRILGAEGIGKVEFSKNFVAYFALLASLGINNYGIREGAKRRNSLKKFSKFVHEILIINILSMLVTYLLFFYILWNINELYEYKSLMCVFSITILFTPMGVEWVYGALEEYRYIAIRTIIFSLIAMVALLVFVKEKEDYIWYAIVLIVSSVGSNIMNLIHMHKFVKFHNYGNYEFKKHLYPIIILFALAISNNLYSYIDTTMIGFMASDTEVGLYSAALKVNRVIVNVLGAVGAVAMPRLSYIWSYGEKNEFDKIVKKVINILLMCSIPCLLGIICMSESILYVFCGVGFSGAKFTMQLLSLIIVILSLSTFFNMHILLPVNKEVKTLIAIVLGLLVNVILNLLLIPAYGIEGAAFGTVMGEAVVLAAGLYFTKNIVNLRELFENFYQYFIAALPIIFICEWMQELFDGWIFQGCFSILFSILLYAFSLVFLFKNKFVLQIIRFLKLKLSKQ